MNENDRTATAPATAAYVDLLDTMFAYFNNGSPQSLRRALDRFEKLKLARTEAEKLLVSMKKGSKPHWGYFFARIIQHQDAMHARFLEISPFKGKVIVVAELSSTTVLFKTNLGFEKFLKQSRLKFLSNDYVLVFDPGMKIENVEVPQQI